MKKQTERKGFSRLGLPVSGGSPGFTGMLINLLFILNTRFFQLLYSYKTSLSFCALLTPLLKC